MTQGKFIPTAATVLYQEADALRVLADSLDTLLMKL